MGGEPAVTDLERSANVFTGFALIGLIAVGAYWIFGAGSYASPRRGAVVTLKQPLVICRSADSVRRKGESGSKANVVALPRILLRECQTVVVGTELIVEEVGIALTRVREKDAIESTYASTDQIMANVPTVAGK
jgi:hypothetical protein